MSRSALKAPIRSGSAVSLLLATSIWRRMGEADVTLNQTDEKPPDPGLLPGEDSVVWSHEVEVCLFHAMIGHKPVGKKTRRRHGANVSMLA